MGLKIKKDIISEFYYGGDEETQSNLNKKEYNNISKKIRRMESQILKDVDEKSREKLENYMEYITQREHRG